MKKFSKINVTVIFAVVSILLMLPVVHKKPRRDRSNFVKSPVTVSASNLKPLDFDALPQWSKTDVVKSLEAFQNSCDVWEKMNPNTSVGSRMVSLKVKDWLPICKVAKELPNPTEEEARGFFEDYFKPYHWRNTHSGKFTGYYSPIFKGSLIRTSKYKTPLYETPKHGIKAYSRAEIYRGALAGKAKVIAWLKNPIDAMALEIEGSGVIDLGDGKKCFVGYDNENGHRYKSIAQMVIDSHILSRAKASTENIRKYFSKHPERIQSFVSRNPSYVYFSKFGDSDFSGAQLSVLTPKYSMAVDRRYIPMGLPLLLSTKRPVNTDGDLKPMSRIMIAQDTGGAIKGPIRGDIYWGAGEKATKIASLMSESGDYWLLLPRHVTA
jgi:membrane-bound lytic murein transglycosylase A